MLKSLLSTVVVLAFIFCGATIAMEALGLLFRTGAPDPEGRMEAFLAQIEANLDPMDVPREAGAEELWPPTDPDQAVESEERKPAEVSHPAPMPASEDKPQPAAAHGGWAPLVVAETEHVVESKPLPASAQAPSPPVISAVRAATSPAVVQTVSQKGQECADGCEAEPTSPRKSRQSARSVRARAPRSTSLLDCPLLGWLEAIVAAPAAPPARRHI